jgi:glycosyltransferase involved in cell wall biosynthesis
MHFWHWRSGSARKLKHHFRGWDYEVARHGAFYDVSAGITLRQHPKVSVLIRTLGKQALLENALATVAHQTYPNLEVVIVEDGPQTLTDFVKAFDGRIPIRYHAFGRNQGRCVAGNKAMELATGEYFVFLDEDDLFYADHIEQLVAAVLSSECKIAYSYAFELPSEYCQASGSIGAEGALSLRYSGAFSFARLLKYNYIPINAVLFHRSLYETCGGFDPAIAYNEDWNLWVRFAIKARPFLLVEKTTCIYRVPMDKTKLKSRTDAMMEHQELVREYQGDLAVSTTVKELLGMLKAAES